jgi:hypothetical protein
MSEIKLDAIDKKLLRACKAKHGRPWVEIITPLLSSDIKRRTLYDRRKYLENAGLIRIDRESRRGRTLCFIETAGENVLLGREETAPKRGGDSP